VPEGRPAAAPRVPLARKAGLVLGGGAALVLVANPATRWWAQWRRQSDPGYGDDVPLLFDVNSETTVPTWYSASLLLVVAAVCGLLAVLARAGGEQGWHRWLVVSGVFAAMSLDETSAVHERLGNALAADLDVGGAGLLWHPWVVVGAPLAAGVVAVVVWAMAGLPPPLRQGVLGGLALYLIGALGLESVGGLVLDEVGDGLAYAAVTWAEEAVEMAGTVVVCCSLLGAVDVRAEGRTMRVALADAAWRPAHRRRR